MFHLCSGYSKNLSAVISLLLQKDPDRRPSPEDLLSFPFVQDAVGTGFYSSGPPVMKSNIGSGSPNIRLKDPSISSHNLIGKYNSLVSR